MRFSLILTLLFISACGKTPVPVSSQMDSSKLLTNCPAGTYDPQDSEELIAMMNALPKPLGAECFLKALKRPLYVNASSSVMSVQPANGTKSPRIFIFKGNLIIALVPDGNGSKFLEFSELKSDVRSIKGEIDLPLSHAIGDEVPFKKVSSCKGCHADERAEYKIGDLQVYSSKALKPSASSDVPVSTLSYEHYLCNFQRDYSKRCEFYRALFHGGEILPKSFPEAMPTLQDSFFP